MMMKLLTKELNHRCTYSYQKSMKRHKRSLYKILYKQQKGKRHDYLSNLSLISSILPVSALVKAISLSIMASETRSLVQSARI